MKIIKHTVAVLAFLLISVEGLGQILQESRSDEFRRNIIAYRTDIPQRLRDSLMRLEPAVTLHSDRIELGRCKGDLTLEGKPMFPKLPGRHIISEYNPGVYYFGDMTKKGLVNAYGEIMIPLDYSFLQYDPKTSIVECAKYETDAKGNSVKTTDYYSIDGQLIVSTGPISTYSKYELYKGGTIFMLWIKDKGYQAFNMKGEAISDLIKCQDVYVGETVITAKMKNGKKKDYPLRYSPQTCPPLNLNKLDYAEAARQSFMHNRWIALALDYYEQGRYEEAKLMLGCYDAFDRMQDIVLSDAAILFCTIWMNCEYELGNYQGLYDLIVKRNALSSYGLSPSINNYDLYTPLKAVKPYQKSAVNYIHECEKIYSEVVTPIVMNADIQRIVREKEAEAERKRRNAEMWSQVIVSVMSGVSEAVANTVAQQNTAPAATPSVVVGGGTAGTVSHSESGSSSSTRESEVVEVHDKCRVCGGTGYCKHCGGTGFGIFAGKKSRCAACDGHPSCKACDGRGYKIRYESR